MSHASCKVHSEKACRHNCGCDIEKSLLIHPVGESAEEDVDNRTECDGNAEYNAVFNIGKSKVSSHVNDEIRHKYLTRNSVYNYDKKSCVKALVVLYYRRPEAVEDIL